MNRLGLTLLAGAAVLGFSTATMAADLIVEPPAPVVPLYTWDGMFIGAFAGGAWGTVTDEIGDLGLVDDELDVSGWVFGLDAGANWTVGNGIVLGIVGDIGWADLNSDDDFVFDGEVPIGPIDASLDWAGSIRGRLGWDGGAWMPYLTAGVAFAHVNASETIDDVFYEDDNTHVGWTAGLGVEFAATQDLSIDLLWRYTDYGTADYALSAPTEFGITANTLTAGLHWRF